MATVMTACGPSSHLAAKGAAVPRHGLARRVRRVGMREDRSGALLFGEAPVGVLRRHGDVRLGDIQRRNNRERGLCGRATMAGDPMASIGDDPDTKERAKSPAAAESAGGARKSAAKSATVIVVGASGDLAKKKIFPALFALYVEGLLPADINVVGYARSPMDHEAFIDRIAENMTCRIKDHFGDDFECDGTLEEFLSRCSYVSGQYDSVDDFKALSSHVDALETARGVAGVGNRLFYLAVPPNVFVAAARGVSEGASSVGGWNRVIVEKPFGRDSASSRELSQGLAQWIDEESTYRIDHYLGKELVQNLLALRFSNLIFEPLWNRHHVKAVQIIFSEDFGTDGRGGYFDQFGIIRDIMQNHLLQVLALFAMEPPVSMGAEDVRDEKVKVLRCVEDLRLEDLVIGQYKGREIKGHYYPGYLEDPTVPEDSNCATFAAACFHCNNARWAGVPFLMKAGKAMDQRRVELRVQFHECATPLFGATTANELVVRVQPEESVYLKINNKVPGMGMNIGTTKLDLQYHSAYGEQGRDMPEAYERLILDAVKGDRQYFIRADELEAAWRIFTPALHAVEDRGTAPEKYPYRSAGPVGAHYLATKYGVKWGDAS